jgi:hypothetical protein
LANPKSHIFTEVLSASLWNDGGDEALKHYVVTAPARLNLDKWQRVDFAPRATNFGAEEFQFIQTDTHGMLMQNEKETPPRSMQTR